MTQSSTPNPAESPSPAQPSSPPSHIIEAKVSVSPTNPQLKTITVISDDPDAFFRNLQAQVESSSHPSSPCPAVAADRVEHLARSGLAVGDIAALLDTTPGQLQQHFTPALRRGRARLRASLLQIQNKLIAADDPDRRVLLWLAQRFLGQEEQEESDKSPNPSPASFASRGWHKAYAGIDFDRV